ncbi:unnamed protein product, partial [Iphiclides podalirius]
MMHCYDGCVLNDWHYWCGVDHWSVDNRCSMVYHGAVGNRCHWVCDNGVGYHRVRYWDHWCNYAGLAVGNNGEKYSLKRIK